MFEGSITLLVPLQEAVESDEEREKFPSVYRRTIICITTFYVFFGITCWMAFGDNVKTVLTTSLPSNILATTVQLAYSVAVIFTFPLQNFPSLEIVFNTIQKSLADNEKVPFWTRRNFITSFLVISLAVIASFTMESLDIVVSLMGSLLGCPISFVFPPLVHNALQKPSKWRRYTNYAVSALGVVAMVLATLTTLMSM